MLIQEQFDLMDWTSYGEERKKRARRKERKARLKAGLKVRTACQLTVSARSRAE